MNRYQAQTFCPERMELGEGALWDDALSRWLWVDITKGAVYEADLAGRVLQKHTVPDFASTVALTTAGDLIVTGQRIVYQIDRADGAVRALFGLPGIPANQRLNDGKPDLGGRLMVGAMVMDGGERCAELFSLSMDGTANPLLGGLGCSNGIGFSPCGNYLYHIDTPQKKVHRYRYDRETGAIHDQTVAVDTSPYQGVPDGMTVDAGGTLYVAMWGGSAVLVFEPERGQLLAKIELPAMYVTSCAFGGPSLSQLLITSASQQDESSNPRAGQCYLADAGARGMPANRL